MAKLTFTEWLTGTENTMYARCHNINRREKIQALSLAKEVYSAKMDLLTNCEVVDDVVKFVNDQKQEGKEQEEAEYNKQQQNEDKKELSSSSSFSTEEEEQEQEEAEQEEEEEERRRQVIIEKE